MAALMLLLFAGFVAYLALWMDDEADPLANGKPPPPTSPGVAGRVHP